MLEVCEMRKFIVLCVLVLMVMVMIPMAVRAATTQNVTITATPSYVSISNAPSTWAIGVIAASGTAATDAGYFVITNTSSVAINVSIWCTSTFTGGNAWTLASNGASASMVVGLYAGTVSGTWDKVVSASPGQVLKSLSASANQSWHMKLWAPTVFTDGVEKTGTVTISAASA
jgi:hypothetical protein